VDAAMNDPNTTQTPANQRPTPTVQIGRLKLTGVWAVLVLLVISGLFVALLIYNRPRVSIVISAGIWLAMDFYWAIAEIKKQKGKAGESPESRRVHGLLTAAALLLLFCPIPGLTGNFVPDTLTTALVGLGVQAGFTLFYLFARFYLGRLWSGAITIMVDHELIQTGPYRFLRHPMYTGMIGMFAGTAIVSGQYHALLGLAVGVIAYWRKIRIEDGVLSAEFGAAYETYRKRTAALIPWVL
jgi:protein-S-isoprenylcysteine O-methyltransferase Ste14